MCPVGRWATIGRMSAATRVAVLAVAAAVACGGAPPRAAAPDEGDCEPGRCLEHVSEVVLSRRAEARACYDEAVARDPALAGGRLIMNFEIDPDGVVVDASQASQDGQLEDAALASCVSLVILGLRFAPSARGKSTRAFHRYEFDVE